MFLKLTSHAVDVHWHQIELGHLLKEEPAGRAGRHCYLDRIRKLGSILIGNQKSVDSRSCVEMRDAFLFQQFPDKRIVDFSKADVDPTHSNNRPGKRPANGMEPGLNSVSFVATRPDGQNLHGKSPEVFASAMAKARLDNVGQGSKVRSTMCKDDALGTRGSARGERNRQHVVFVIGMAVQTIPTLASLLLIVRETFDNSLVKWASVGAVVHFGVLLKISTCKWSPLNLYLQCPR